MMRRIATATATVTVALAGAGLLGPAAQAAGIPTYTCDLLGGDPGTAHLTGNCAASPGAVTNGDFAGESIVESRRSPTRAKCTHGGRAELPAQVFAFDCVRIG